jgi:hypothetical protein
MKLYRLKNTRNWLFGKIEITTRKIVAVANRILHLNVFNIFEPKEIKVEDYWLSGIYKNDKGDLDIKTLVKPDGPRPDTLDGAMRRLATASKTINDSGETNSTLPIWCIKNPSPFISSIKALFLDNLPCRIVNQIVQLRLEDPIEIRTRFGKIISVSIIDFSPTRLLIIGNTLEILNNTKIFITRLFLSKDNLNEIGSRIREIFNTRYEGPLGSNLILGGFSAIYFFESACIISKITSIKEISSLQTIGIIAAIFSFGAFLVFEALGRKAIAFEASWITTFYYIAFMSFLAYLVIAPFLIAVIDVNESNSLFLLRGAQFHSLILIICAFIRGLGIIFDKSAFSKGSYLSVWVLLSLFILFIPNLQ